MLLARFMVFGLAVGFTELAADVWLVDYTRTLDYSNGGEPMLWRSPLWMPFAWEVVAVQFGTVGLWLWQRYHGWGLVTAGILGAINIPYYEEMARRINWWVYRDCRMLSYTPYYIILGEFGIVILLTLLAKQVSRGNWTTALLAGIAGGIGIFICYALAYSLTDGLITSRLLTKSASGVLATLRGSTYGREYASPLRLLRPCWTAFLNSLRGNSGSVCGRRRSSISEVVISFVNNLLDNASTNDQLFSDRYGSCPRSRLRSVSRHVVAAVAVSWKRPVDWSFQNLHSCEDV